MTDFPTPPRGRHWRDDRAEPTRYEPGRVRTDSGFLPRIEEPRPRDPVADSGGGLYRVPVPGDPDPYPPEDDYHREDLGPAISQTRLRMNRPTGSPVPSRERTDLVVPRVYLEPDEAMDRLRARASRWAIARDIVIIILGASLIFRWILTPLWQAMGF